jgi:signal transduction histidine kinase
VVEQVAQAERPLFWRMPDFPEPRLQQALQSEGMAVSVCVPWMVKRKLVGAFVLGTRRDHEVTAEELSLLGAIGQQIGVAVENARLYQQAEETAAAAERTRLARELHDAVTQTLFSASLIAEVLPDVWSMSEDEGRRRLEELRQLTRGALAEMRTLLVELRPNALVQIPLADLLRQLCESLVGRSRLPIEVSVEGQRKLPPDVQVALYRITQEALNNVVKHSHATQVLVTLRLHETVRLSIADDGSGFDPARVPPDHLGLKIMRERADSIGARISIESQPGEGTQVSVSWKGPRHEGETQ